MCFSGGDCRDGRHYTLKKNGQAAEILSGVELTRRSAFSSEDIIVALDCPALLDRDRGRVQIENGTWKRIPADIS